MHVADVLTLCVCAAARIDGG
jgi:hypothetical protein